MFLDSKDRAGSRRSLCRLLLRLYDSLPEIRKVTTATRGALVSCFPWVDLHDAALNQVKRFDIYLIILETYPVPSDG